MRIICGKHRGTKLYTLEGRDTRPTLDRVKEPLFSIVNFNLPGARILDLFSGSGAIGLEALSRGAKEAILCDNSPKAIHIIEQNVDKLKEKENAKIVFGDYEKVLKTLKKEEQKFDIIFLDPPYETDYCEKASKIIMEYGLLNKDGIIIIETDRIEIVRENINKLKLFDIYDERKYGRVNLIFMKGYF